MDENKRKKRALRMRRKWVNMMKHKHPSANFGQLWSEAEDKYPA